MKAWRAGALGRLRSEPFGDRLFRLRGFSRRPRLGVGKHNSWINPETGRERPRSPALHAVPLRGRIKRRDPPLHVEPLAARR